MGKPIAITYATGMTRPRTTALFFDKLWVHPALMEGSPHVNASQAVPREVCMSIPSPAEARAYMVAFGCNCRPIVPGEIAFLHLSSFGEEAFYEELRQEHSLYYPRGGAAVSEEEFVEGSLQHFGLRSAGTQQPSIDESPHWRELPTYHRNLVLRAIAWHYASEGKNVTPVFLDPSEYDSGPGLGWGSGPGLELCLDYIPIALDQELRWEQVLGFRRDSEAVEKLRRLRNWFSIELVAKSKEYACANIEKAIDDYNWALKKHGIQTIIGGVTTIIAASTMPTTMELISGSPLASAAGGLAVAAGALAWVTKRRLKLAGIERGPVAYIHAARKLALPRGSKRA